MTAAVRLVNATIELIDAEDRSVGDLCARLGAEAPADWPPEHHGPETRAWFRAKIAEAPGEAGWWTWYIVALDPASGAATGRLVGVCGYKGPPDGSGMVEIGYSVARPHQRRGYASAAVEGLVAMAFETPHVRFVRAETLPELVASQAVLRSTGFERAPDVRDVDGRTLLRYERRRPGASGAAPGA